MTDSIRGRCPDEGTCHHGCEGLNCFRLAAAAPLSAAGFYEDRWPDDKVILLKHPEKPDELRFNYTHGNVPGATQVHAPPKFALGTKVIWVPPRPSMMGPPQEGRVVMNYDEEPRCQVKTANGIYLCDERDVHEHVPGERPYTEADKQAGDRMRAAEQPVAKAYADRTSPAGRPRTWTVTRVWHGVEAESAALAIEATYVEGSFHDEVSAE